MRKNLLISIIIQILSVVTTLLLGIFNILSPYEVVLISFLIVIFENIVFLLVETEKRQGTFNLIEKYFEAFNIEKYKRKPIQYELARNIVDSTISQLSEIDKGHLLLSTQEIPDLSFQIIASTKHNVINTFIESKNAISYYRSKVGIRYLNECRQLARKIKDFSRIFILKNINNIGIETQKIIIDDHNNGINVSLKNYETIEEQLGHVDDFGLWDNEILAIVNSSNHESALLNIFIGGDSAIKYQKIAKKLLTISDNWKESLAIISKPQNQENWYQLLNREIITDPPLSLSDEDVKIIFESAEKAISNINKILILGYTKKLVDYFLINSNYEIHILDINYYNIAKNDRIKYHVGNWVNWEYEDKFDIIIGDEVLNNLTTNQYLFFLNNLHELLTSNGLLFLRNLWLYGQKSEQEKFEIINTFLEDRNFYEYAVNSLVLLFLNHDILYDSKTYSSNIDNWNTLLSHKDFIKNVETKNQSKLEKLRIRFNLKLSVCTPEYLFEILEYKFKVVDIKGIGSDYPQKYAWIGDYYKIIVLERKTLPNNVYKK